MSETWDSAPLAPSAPAAPAPAAWDTAPVVGPSPQQKAVISSTDNGDEAAKALQIQKKTGIPASVVQSDLPGYDAHARQQSAVKAIQNPFIAKYIDTSANGAKVSGDDYEKLDEVSQYFQNLKQDQINNRAQVGVFAGIAEVGNLLASPPGREKLYNALTQLPAAIGHGLLDFVQTPGKVQSGEINLTTPEGLNQGIGFGLGVALGTRDIRVGRTGDMAGGVSTPADVDAFLAKVRGAKTRQEIDAFLAEKAGGSAIKPLLLGVERANIASEALTQAVEAAQQSTTKVRSPETFAEFGAAHGDDVVYIDAAKIMELYQKEGKVPAEGDGLFGFVPGLAGKLHEGEATGGEVTIPVSQYVAYIDPAVHEGLKDSVRLHDDGVTLAEAEDHKAAIEAWHGTPHDFEKFDLTKIGTGEGAQVYGHGLYFAENRGVAEHYGKTVTEQLHQKSEPVIIPGNPFSGAEILVPDESFKSNTYKVSIAADPTHFLDWDLPLSEQSPNVQAALEKLGINVKMNATMEGSFAHDHLRDIEESKIMAERETAGSPLPKISDAPERVSKALAEAGIPGIKYLDQGSRPGPGAVTSAGMKLEAPKPTRNFVIFDDRLVSIKEKNGEPIAAMLEAAVETEKLFLGLKTTPFMNMLFKDAKSVGITDTEFTKYSDKIARAEQAILDKSVAVGKREAAQRLGPEWKRNEATVKDEVTNELTNTGAFAAEKYLRDNRIDIAHDRAADVADDLAPLFGFENGQDLLRGLQAIETEKAASGKGPQVQLRDAIKAETAARMEERYGNLAENIAKEAREIALADHTFDILADEVRLLAKAAKIAPPLSRENMVEWAEGAFEQRNIKDAADWTKHQRTVAKGGRTAEKELLKGDFREAFQAKQEQFLAAIWAKESIALQKVIDGAEKKIDRFSTEEVIPSIDQAYLEQIRQMLASVGIPQQFAPLRDTGPLRDFVANSEGQIAVAPWLMDGSQPKLQDMSVGQFRDFVKSMQSLEHVGRAAKTLDSAYGKAEVQNVIFDIKKELDRFDLIEQPLNPTVPQRIRAVGRWITAAHLLVERMLDYTDKFSPEGPLTRFLDRPLRDSNVKEIQLTEKVSKQLRELKQYTDSSVNELIPNKLIPDTLSSTGFLNMDRGNLRQLMLLMGTRSGAGKVAEGFGVNEADVRRFMDQNATEKDWKWVQGMWKMFADLKVEADAMQLRDTGVPADTLTPVPITTPFGEVTGGYAPLVYDRSRSNIQGDIAAKNPIFEPHYISATTPHGYTIARTQYQGPLDLTGTLMPSKIQAMVHDIAFREAVRNASKLINNDEFMAEMTKKWSKEYAGLLPGWLRDIANVHNVDDSYAMGAARVMAGLRQNITSGLIAFNPGTFIKHGVTAASMSTERVGAAAIASAVKELGLKSIVENARDLVRSTDSRPEPEFIDALKEVTDPSERGDNARQFVLDSSAVMRARQRKFQDSIRGAYETGAEAGPWQSAKDFRHAAMNLGRFPVALSDAVSAMPTWLAAYKKAFAGGADHADAVFQADKEVSRAHGSGFIGDKPRVQRTGELMRWITPLYTFWNHMANNYFQAAWDMSAMISGPKIAGELEAPDIINMSKNAKGEWQYKPEPNATVRAMSNKLFWLVIIPLIVEETAGPVKDEHGDRPGMQALKAVGRHFGSSIIGLRDITNAALGGYDPSIGMTGILLKTMSDTGKDIQRLGAKGAATRDWMIHSFSALAALTGVGGAQVGRTANFVKDLTTGQERPRTFNDYRQGLRTGHSKARMFK